MQHPSFMFLDSHILAYTGYLAPGAKALQQINSGKVITPRMEMMFEGVGRRSFSYTFNFIPKSADEAKTIQEIIYTFKENMMPSYSNASTRREMNIPNTFFSRKAIPPIVSGISRRRFASITGCSFSFTINFHICWLLTIKNGIKIYD